MRTLYLAAVILIGCQDVSGDILDGSGHTIGSYECHTSSTFNGSEVHVSMKNPNGNRDHLLFTQSGDYPLLIPLSRSEEGFDIFLLSRSCDDLFSGVIEAL